MDLPAPTPESELCAALLLKTAEAARAFVEAAELARQSPAFFVLGARFDTAALAVLDRVGGAVHAHFDAFCEAPIDTVTRGELAMLDAACVARLGEVRR